MSVNFASWRLCALWVVTALLTGCAGVSVRTADPATYLAERRADVLTSGKVSPSTQESLRVLGLDLGNCQSDIPACTHQLLTSAGLYDEQRMAALAELWTEFALALPGSALLPQQRRTDEINAWLEAARYAWAYLFFTQRPASDRAFDDRQQQVRDYYNHAVQQALTGMFALHGATAQPIPSQFGNWRLQTDFSGLWLPANKSVPYEVVPATSLRFSGLRNLYRRDGLGAELIAVFQDPLANEQNPSDNSSIQGPEPAPFQESLFPSVTLLLRFAGNTLQDVLATQALEIVAFDPYRTRQWQVQGTSIPLAGNFSSGYGLWLARSNFSTQALRTLIGLSNGIVRPTIYLMQPYDPNRRLIVMLHGLASSPEAWINVANEVLGDATLRHNYQVWQVYYPTNAPLALNNHTIRKALQYTLQHFDPSGSARASRDITLVGHSMGGVLARLMVSSTQGRSTKQLQTAAQLPDALNDVSGMLEFEPFPNVSTAIFIAAPHQGTHIANNRVARWASNLVTLPLSMVEQFGDVTRSLAQASPRIGKQSLLRIPNSIDNLSDDHPYIRLTSQLPVSPQVRYHSIIGNITPQRSPEDSSDGIVPYRSAHLPQAHSELMVPFGHSVQEHPRAIVEIRRILHNQLLGQPIR